MAIYHLTHRTVGRSTHAEGTAGAHLSYITRASACRAVIAAHIPAAAPGSQGGQARRWMDEQEQADRKNARVVDKLEIALPLELTQEQRVQAVRDFVKALSGGQEIGFFAAFHDKTGTKDEANPHAHLVIRDRNPETGKGRVIGMSEKGSTERARQIWEQVCNDALARAGTESRIDRRTLKAQREDAIAEFDRRLEDGQTPSEEEIERIVDLHRAPSGHEGPTVREMAARGDQTTLDKLERLSEARKSATERQNQAREDLMRKIATADAKRAAQKAQEEAATSEDAQMIEHLFAESALPPLKAGMPRLEEWAFTERQKTDRAYRQTAFSQDKTLLTSPAFLEFHRRFMLGARLLATLEYIRREANWKVTSKTAEKLRDEIRDVSKLAQDQITSRLHSLDTTLAAARHSLNLARDWLAGKLPTLQFHPPALKDVVAVFHNRGDQEIRDEQTFLSIEPAEQLDQLTTLEPSILASALGQLDETHAQTLIETEIQKTRPYWQDREAEAREELETALSLKSTLEREQKRREQRNRQNQNTRGQSSGPSM